jgi:hypothetical protein
VYVLQNNGADVTDFGGLHKSQDVAIDDATQLVFSTGFKNNHSGCNPVQVAYLRAHSFDGTQQWKNYDWAGTMLDNCDGDGYENNMADTRGYRVSVGDDGKLYCAFESAGGNHIFRRHPRDLSKSVTIVGGDFWHEWYNTRSEHKTFFARFEPDDGEYLLGQQFCTRYCATATDCKCTGNAVRVKNGNISADVNGNVYLVGTSASGLPIPDYSDCKSFTTPQGGSAYNPFDVKTYSGGAYILVMDSSFSTRLYCTRLSGGTTNGVGTRLSTDGTTTVAWAGEVKMLGTDFKDNKQWLLDTKEPLQPERGGGDREAFFAVATNETLATNSITDGKKAAAGGRPVTINNLHRQNMVRITIRGTAPMQVQAFTLGGKLLHKTDSDRSGMATMKLPQFSGMAIFRVTGNGSSYEEAVLIR